MLAQMDLMESANDQEKIRKSPANNRKSIFALKTRNLILLHLK